MYKAKKCARNHSTPYREILFVLVYVNGRGCHEVYILIGLLAQLVYAFWISFSTENGCVR